MSWKFFGFILLAIAGVFALWEIGLNVWNFFFPLGTTKNNPVDPGMAASPAPNSPVTGSPGTFAYNGVPVTVYATPNLMQAVWGVQAQAANGQYYWWGQYVAGGPNIDGSNGFEPFANQSAVSAYMQSQYGLTAAEFSSNGD